MSDPKKIIQIMPADGWRMEQCLGRDHFVSEPLVGWGVTEGGEVVALTHDLDVGAEPAYPVGVCEIYHPTENEVNMSERREGMVQKLADMRMRARGVA